MRVFFVLAAFLSCGFVSAEVGEYSLSNGIPVFVRGIPGGKIRALYFVIGGGLSLVPEEFSGIEESTVTMMVSGSEKYPYRENQAFFHETRSSFSWFSDPDGAAVSMVSIDKYFDETFSRFVDGFLNPSCEPEPYDSMMRKSRLRIQSKMNEPSSLVFHYARLLNFSDHPYRTSTEATEDSIENLSVENIKKHHDALMDSSRIMVVAAGDYDVQKLLSDLEGSIGKLSDRGGKFGFADVPPLKIGGENGLFVHEGSAGTGYLVRTFEGPGFRHEDFPVFLLTASIYTDILYNVVREKYGICYSPSSSLYSGGAAFGYEYLYRTSDFKNFPKALEEARKIMADGKVVSGKDSLGNHVLSPLESRLEGYRNGCMTGRYARQATANGIALSMCGGLLSFNDVHASEKINSAIKDADAERIVEVFKKYWIEGSDRWFCVTGAENRTELEETLERLKKLDF